MKQGQGRFNSQKDSKIRSGLDMVRELKNPSVIEGEKVLAHGQAAYDAGTISRSKWKMGFLYLTGTRLMFAQGGNRLFEIPLDSLNEPRVVNRNWVPGKSVQQLRLIGGSGEKDNIFYLSVEEPGPWAETIETTKKENAR